MKSAVITLPRHMHKDEHCGDVLRNNAGKRDAVLRHMAYDNEKQIEDNVQNTCNHEICKRTLRITVCTEDTVAEVENSESRHAERINAEIKHGTLDKVVLCAEKFQHKPRGNQTKRRYDTACREAYYK